MENEKYLPHDIDIKYNACKMYQECQDIKAVCQKYSISRTSLYRWLNRFNGTKESLMDKSHKPKTKHLNAHTEEELNYIMEYIKKNPNMTSCELYNKLKEEKGYSRNKVSFYRLLQKKGLYKYTYTKWKIDINQINKNQYTYLCIDENTKQSFSSTYKKITAIYTIDFIKNCLEYYNYVPNKIETSNEIEITFR